MEGKDENSNKRTVSDGMAPDMLIRNRGLNLISWNMCKGPVARVWRVSGGWAVSTHCCGGLTTWPVTGLHIPVIATLSLSFLLLCALPVSLCWQLSECFWAVVKCHFLYYCLSWYLTGFIEGADVCPSTLASTKGLLPLFQEQVCVILVCSGT